MMMAGWWVVVVVLLALGWSRLETPLPFGVEVGPWQSQPVPTRTGVLAPNSRLGSCRSLGLVRMAEAERPVVDRHVKRVVPAGDRTMNDVLIVGSNAGPRRGDCGAGTRRARLRRHGRRLDRRRGP